MWPWGRGQFWPHGYNLNNLGTGSIDKAVYQISKTWAFWFQTRRFLKVFPYKGLCKMWPLGWGQFWPQGYNLNNFGNGPLVEATYQISKTWAFWFQTRRFLKVFAYFHLFVAIATRVLHGFQIFEQLSVSTSEESFWWSMVQIGPVV